MTNFCEHVEQEILWSWTISIYVGVWTVDFFCPKRC